MPTSDIDYRVANLSEEYRITYKDGETNVEIHLGKELDINLVSLTSPAYKVTIHPKFIKTTKGYLISGIDCDTTDTSNSSLHVIMAIKYQYVDVEKMV